MWCSILTSAVLATPVLAQSRRGPRPEMPSTQPAASSPAGKPDGAPAEDGKLSVTQHQITLDGKSLDYRATAGNMVMKDEAGKAKANIFFVSYDTQQPDPTTRPITFLFNGGPGAASVWLHLGAAGPKTVELDANALPVGPPFKLVDNQATWLRGSDLVFIDPVSTGFSRAAAGEDPGQFHGYTNDIASVADFIRVYITKNNRWGSPIYLAGESYGTTRASGLAGYLAERYGISVNGITLVSSVLDFQTLEPGGGNDLPYELFLPTYSAVAWYHKRLGPEYQADMDKTINAARKFATDEYAPALLKGASLTADERTHIIKQLSALTGINADLIDRANLRIGPGMFEKEVLGDGKQIIGRYDGRITGFDPNAEHGGPSYDPSLSRYRPAYSAAFNQYIRNELKFESDLPYEVLTGKVHPWSMNDEHGGYLYVTDDLESALVQNPHMRVQFISGYYDLATPFFSADYTIDRMNLSPEVRANVTHLYFPSGHMVYHNRDSAKKMAEAIEKFVAVKAATTQP
jgi:carboxypeptidase C (cathepsin A)